MLTKGLICTAKTTRSRKITVDACQDAGSLVRCGWKPKQSQTCQSRDHIWPRPGRFSLASLGSHEHVAHIAPFFLSLLNIFKQSAKISLQPLATLDSFLSADTAQDQNVIRGNWTDHTAGHWTEISSQLAFPRPEKPRKQETGHGVSISLQCHEAIKRRANKRKGLSNCDLWGKRLPFLRAKWNRWSIRTPPQLSFLFVSPRLVQLRHFGLSH